MIIIFFDLYYLFFSLYVQFCKTIMNKHIFFQVNSMDKYSEL